MRYRGLSLIEVAIVICLIAVLALVSLPMLTRANGEARSTACRANLTTLGEQLEYHLDARGELPALLNRDGLDLDVPTIDQILGVGSPARAALQCPSDDEGFYERSGTSYQWFAVWDRLTRYAPEPDPLTPLLADKAPFHTEQHHPYNALFPITTSDTRRLPGDPVMPATPAFNATPYALPQ